MIDALFLRPRSLSPLPADGPIGTEVLERLAKIFFPVPALIVVLPLLYWFFRQTWRELDEDAHRHRGEILAQGKIDLRPFIAMPLCALILTLQDYYGGRLLRGPDPARPLALRGGNPGACGSGSTTSSTASPVGDGQDLGYVVVPFSVWKILFLATRSSTSAYGRVGSSSTRDLRALPRGGRPRDVDREPEPDFGTYYPF